MSDNKSPKERQKPSGKSKPPASPESESQMPVSPITEDTPGIYFEKVTSAARKAPLFWLSFPV